MPRADGLEITARYEGTEDSFVWEQRVDANDGAVCFYDLRPESPLFFSAARCDGRGAGGRRPSVPKESRRAPCDVRSSRWPYVAHEQRLGSGSSELRNDAGTWFERKRNRSAGGEARGSWR